MCSGDSRVWSTSRNRSHVTIIQSSITDEFIFQVASPETESLISKLHYRVTSIIFLICCVLVTCVEYIGNGVNIACIQDGHPDYWAIPQHVMNTYCFIMGTFTLPRHFAGEKGTDLIHPGVGEYNKERDEVT